MKNEVTKVGLSKAKVQILSIGSLAISIILYLFSSKLYLSSSSQSFQTILEAASSGVKNPNFNAEMSTVFSIISLTNSSLISLLIFPLFMAIGVLFFVVFLLFRRISELNKELITIKEKLNV